MRAASAARSKWLERQKKGWTVYKRACIVTVIMAACKNNRGAL